MEVFLVVKKALVVWIVAAIIVLLCREKNKCRFIWSVWKAFDIKMFLEVCVVVVLTLGTILLLFQVPGFNYGWMHLFFTGGGNVFITPISEGSESSSYLIRLMVSVSFLVFICVVPFLAKYEEDVFRRGFNTWSAVAKQSVKFGLVHCLVGLPLAAGGALIISGAFYGYKYKTCFERNVNVIGQREAEDKAVMMSTSCHTMYNTIIFGLLFARSVQAL